MSATRHPCEDVRSSNLETRAIDVSHHGTHCHFRQRYPRLRTNAIPNVAVSLSTVTAQEPTLGGFAGTGQRVNGTNTRLHTWSMAMVNDQEIELHRPTQTTMHPKPSIKRAIFTLLALSCLTVMPANANEHYLDDEAIERAAEKATENATRAVNDGLGVHIRKAVECGQILIAEGDSWFQYPFKSDIVDQLRREDWIVYSTAHYGDTLESMLYGPRQLSSVYSVLVQLKEMLVTTGTTSQPESCKLEKDNGLPKAILLSAGGNEIVGKHLEFFMDHADSSNLSISDADKNGLNDAIEFGLFRRLSRLLYEYFVSVSHLCNVVYQEKCEHIPIFVHGYDYPRATGDGYGWFGFAFAGPWIRPVFESKQRLSDDDGREIIEGLVDKFNAVLESMVEKVSSPIVNPVCYLDLVGKVGSDWADEIHPNKTAAKRLSRIVNNEVVNFHVRSEIEDGICQLPSRN